MMSHTRILSLLCVFTFAACAPLPVERTRGFELPPSWTAPVNSMAAVWPAAAWWRGFGSKELDRLIAAARTNNLDLGAAAARVLQAQAQARISGAPLGPNADLGADAARQDNAGDTDSSDSYGVDLAASYELDFWGRNRAGLDAARASLNASRHDQETVALTVVSNVANSYFQVLSLRERLDIARRNLANAERVLALVEARVRNGAVSPLDLAQQRAAVARQRTAIPPLQQQQRESLAALATLLGRPPQGFGITQTNLSKIAAPQIAPGLPSELLMRRPDIGRTEAQLAAAEADIAAARAAFFPGIRLTGSTGLRSAQLASFFDGSATYNLAVSLTQPLFNAGLLSGQYNFAVARHQELIQNYRAAILVALTEVETALTRLHHLRDQIEFQHQELEQARIAFQIAETRYRAGAEDLITVLDAQRTLFQAQDQNLQLRVAHLQAMVTLFRALGGGWSNPAMTATETDVL